MFEQGFDFKVLHDDALLGLLLADLFFSLGELNLIGDAQLARKNHACAPTYQIHAEDAACVWQVSQELFNDVRGKSSATPRLGLPLHRRKIGV